MVYRKKKIIQKELKNLDIVMIFINAKIFITKNNITIEYDIKKYIDLNKNEIILDIISIFKKIEKNKGFFNRLINFLYDLFWGNLFYDLSYNLNDDYNEVSKIHYVKKVVPEMSKEVLDNKKQNIRNILKIKGIF